MQYATLYLLYFAVNFSVFLVLPPSVRTSTTRGRWWGDPVLRLWWNPLEGLTLTMAASDANCQRTWWGKKDPCLSPVHSSQPNSTVWSPKLLSNICHWGLFGSWHERNTRPPALNATTQAMPSWRWPSRDLFLLSFEPSIWKNCYLGEHRLVAILAPEDFIHSVILVRQESIIFLWRYKRNWIFGYCMRLKNFDLQIVQKTVFNLGTGLPNNVDSLSIV